MSPPKETQQNLENGKSSNPFSHSRANSHPSAPNTSNLRPSDPFINQYRRLAPRERGRHDDGSILNQEQVTKAYKESIANRRNAPANIGYTEFPSRETLIPRSTLRPSNPRHAFYTCLRCAQVGHIAKDCPNEAAPKDIQERLRMSLGLPKREDAQYPAFPTHAPPTGPAQSKLVAEKTCPEDKAYSLRRFLDFDDTKLITRDLNSVNLNESAVGSKGANGSVDDESQSSKSEAGYDEPVQGMPNRMGKSMVGTRRTTDSAVRRGGKVAETIGRARGKQISDEMKTGQAEEQMLGKMAQHLNDGRTRNPNGSPKPREPGTPGKDTRSVPLNSQFATPAKTGYPQWRFGKNGGE